MKPEMRGRFITLEGGEGAGKTTQIRRLGERLKGSGIAVTATREPGGSPGAEAIRSLLVTGATDRWDAMTEALLLAAARRDHVLRTIRPALERGDWVVSDRFADSTRAYQGAGLGVPEAAIESTIALATDGLSPDLTIILDLPVADGLARAGLRPDAAQRYERMSLALHERIRGRFLAIAQAEPARCIVVDARGDEAAVAGRIEAAVTERLLT